MQILRLCFELVDFRNVYRKISVKFLFTNRNGRCGLIWITINSLEFFIKTQSNLAIPYEMALKLLIVRQFAWNAFKL